MHVLRIAAPLVHPLLLGGDSLATARAMQCAGGAITSAKAEARQQLVAANTTVQVQPVRHRAAGHRHAPSSSRRAMRAVTCSAAQAAGEAATKVVDSGLPRTAVVGVLGGGQLGKMMAQEAVSGGRRGGTTVARILSCIDCWPAAIVRHTKCAACIELLPASSQAEAVSPLCSSDLPVLLLPPSAADPAAWPAAAVPPTLPLERCGKVALRSLPNRPPCFNCRPRWV